MRWLSLFRREHRTWMPVTNVDHDANNMDDLMRMAIDESILEDDDEQDLISCLEPDLRIHQDQGLLDATSQQTGIRTNSLLANDFEVPVFSHEASLKSFSDDHSPSSQSYTLSSSSRTPSLSSGNVVSPNSDHHESFPESNESSRTYKKHNYRFPCFCNLPKPTFPEHKICLIVLSILVPLLCIGLCAGLGIYSIFVYKTDKLVIDKSVKSFSIPNHKVYKQFEAMMLARRDNSSAGRSKRSVASNSYNKEQRLDRFFSRSKRESFDQMESGTLQETEEALRRANLAGNGFTKGESQTDSSSLSPSAASGGFFSDILHRIKRRSHEVGCIFAYQSVTRWKMHVIYLAQGDEDDNMFTKERLETIHDIERQIMNHPGFHNFCLRDPNIQRFDSAVSSMKGCVPLNSLMTYFYPSEDTQGHIFYDGMGSNIDDINSALTLAMNHETFYYYVDDKINKTNKRSHLIRSEVLFGAPLQGFSCIQGSSVHDEQDKKFKDFVITYIDLLSTVSTDKVRVLYGGKEIFDYEVTTTFWRDIRLAIISLIAIFALMLVLTLSLYLTVVGIIIIALSFPISLFFYRVVFEINALGILTGAAVFVIIGIGVDDIFVFVNIYRQASHMTNPVKRIKYTVKTAGLATFFTSFTTAAAFAANLASSIPAVYDFGLFMALIVSSCWVSVFMLMPPLLYFHACCIEPLETLLFACFSCLKKRTDHHDNRLQAMSSSLIASQEEEVGIYQDDDDVPMLNVQGPTDSPDDQMLSPVDGDGNTASDPFSRVSRNHRYLGSTTTTNNNNMCFGRLIQKSVMFLTNRIVLPGRYIIIAAFVLVLATSCFLISRLQPTTHPPQLFRPETNIQRLLDLKANFSIIDSLHCDRCSGLYKVHPSSTHGSIEEPPTPLRPPSLPPSVPLPPTSKGSTGDSHRAPGSTSGSETDDSTHSSRYDTYAKPGTSSQFMNSILSPLFNRSRAIPLKVVAQGLASLLSSLESVKENETSEMAHPKSTISPSFSKVATTPESHKPVDANVIQRKEPNRNDQPRRGDMRRKPRHKLQSQSNGTLSENFNVCKDQRCNNMKDRPLMESGTTVYVVFGISGVDRSNEDVGHVMDLFKGKAVFDHSFADAYNIRKLNEDNVRELCRVCHFLSNMTELIKEGSAQCLPRASSMYQLRHFLATIDECRDLPSSLSIYHHQAPAHAEGGLDREGRLLWLAFAFESTTREGVAYSQAYKQYLKWEQVIQHIKDHMLAPNSPLKSIFQTSEFWTKVMMEVVAVNSAIYGLVLSMLICMISVSIFTGHLTLLVIVFITITVMICCVVGIFYLAGWEMGAVEAVSLSILVGSSVDYCVHIVEGYILAGRRMDASEMKTQTSQNLRKFRTSQAVRHIGVAIVCSGLTTMIAAVPLTQTYIQPFTKFGSILLINTTVSLILTLTLATALLATFAPPRFRGKFKSHVIALGVVLVVNGLGVLVLYIMSRCGIHIPGPSGDPLFT